MCDPTAVHESAHCVAALSLGAEVDRAVIHARGGFSAILMTHLGTVERAAILMAGPEGAMMLAGVGGPVAWGRSAVSDKAKLAALKLTAAVEVQAFDLCRLVLSRNRSAVLALAGAFRPNVELSEHAILNAVAGRVVYFTGAVR
jgi:hypothetical protein